MEKQIIDELQLLLDFCSPRKLRQLITFLYFEYLQSGVKSGNEKNAFKEMAEDVYFLIRFFEIAERYKSDSNEQNQQSSEVWNDRK